MSTNELTLLILAMTYAVIVLVCGLGDWDYRYRPYPVTAAMHWRGVAYGLLLVLLAWLSVLSGFVLVVNVGLHCLI